MISFQKEIDLVTGWKTLTTRWAIHLAEARNTKNTQKNTYIVTNTTQRLTPEIQVVVGCSISCVINTNIAPQAKRGRLSRQDKALENNIEAYSEGTIIGYCKVPSV